jgi:hypothetical protein
LAGVVEDDFGVVFVVDDFAAKSDVLVGEGFDCVTGERFIK